MPWLSDSDRSAVAADSGGTDALASAYTRLYQNHDGLTDAWGMQWAEVAKRLASKPGLLGLELLNEPWR